MALPNFSYAKPKPKETPVTINPAMTDSAVLAMMLDDMTSLGLIKLIEKRCWSATEEKLRAEDRNGGKKAA